MAWIRNPATEKLLNDLGIKYEYRTNIKIGNLLISESKRNNARFGKPIDPDQVQKYVYDMQHGHVFPAMVLGKDYYILAGNHRAEAAVEAKVPVIDAYVVTEATPAQTTEFIWKDNMQHGLLLTEDQKIMSAVEIHRRVGRPMRELNNEMFGGNSRTYERIVAANQAKDVEEKLLNLGVDAGRIPASVLTGLYPINDNTHVLKEVGLMTIEYGLGFSEVDELKKAVRGKSTEADRLTVLNEFRTARKDKVQGKKAAPVTLLKKHISTLTSFIESGNEGYQFSTLADLGQLDPKVVKELKGNITKLVDLLRNLKK